ncbi:hypothetical protein AgCh_030669 [Apium graveolens]
MLTWHKWGPLADVVADVASNLALQALHLLSGVAIDGLFRVVFLSNTLTNLYVKLGDLGCARLMFDDMSQRNMVSRACLVSGYVQNSYAIGSVLRGCYKLGSRGVGLGLQVHGLVPKTVDADVSTSGGNTSCANDETSMNDSLMMVVCAQRAPGKEIVCNNKLNKFRMTFNIIAETGDSWFNFQKLKLPKGCGGYTIEVEIHDGPYNVIKNWNYTALVDAIHNGEGKCWTTKVRCEEDLVEAIETATGEKKDFLCFIKVICHKDNTSKELLEWGSRVSADNSHPPNPC